MSDWWWWHSRIESLQVLLTLDFRLGLGLGLWQYFPLKWRRQSVKRVENLRKFHSLFFIQLLQMTEKEKQKLFIISHRNILCIFVVILNENRRWIRFISGNVYSFKSHLRKEKDEIRECQRWNRKVFIILFNFISDMLTATFCWYFSIRLILISTFQFWQLQSRMLQNICEILAVFINSCKVEQRGKLAEQFSEGEDPKV